MLDKTDDFAQHVDLHGGWHFVVERFDLGPQRPQVEDVTHDHRGAGNLRCGAAGARLHLVDKGDAGSVGEIVGDDCGSDLAMQWMGGYLFREPLAQCRREVATKLAVEFRRFGQIRSQQLAIQAHLRISEQDRELGANEPATLRCPRREGLVVRQELKSPIQSTRPFEIAHQARLPVEDGDAARFGHRQRLALQVIVAQYQSRDVIGHGGEKRLALDCGEDSRSNRAVEQDLDVDLVVRHIDTAGIVDCVGVDAAAGERKRDTPALGYREVGALADHSCANLIAIDPQGIIGAVANLDMAFVGSLYIGPDTAEPQEVDRGSQEPADQLGRCQNVNLDVKDTLHFGTDRDRLGAAFEYPAARRDQSTVVIRPARSGLAEQTLPFKKALFRIGCWIDEHVKMVKRAKQPQVARHQHAVAKYIARHVADADHAQLGLL